MEKNPRHSHLAYLLYVDSLGHQSAPGSKCEFCLSPPSSRGRQGSLLFLGLQKPHPGHKVWPARETGRHLGSQKHCEGKAGRREPSVSLQSSRYIQVAPRPLSGTGGGNSSTRSCYSFPWTLRSTQTNCGARLLSLYLADFY